MVTPFLPLSTRSSDSTSLSRERPFLCTRFLFALMFVIAPIGYSVCQHATRQNYSLAAGFVGLATTSLEGLVSPESALGAMLTGAASCLSSTGEAAGLFAGDAGACTHAGSGFFSFV